MNNIEKNKMNTGSKIFKYQNRICIVKETDTFRNRFKGTVLAKDDVEVYLININLSHIEKRNTFHRLLKGKKLINFYINGEVMRVAR